MSITFHEEWSSRSQQTGANATAETRWIADGSDDPDAVRVAALADATVTAAIYVDLVIQSVSVERISHSACRVVVNYGLLKPPEEGQSTYTFNTVGGTEHISHAISTVGSYPASGRPTIDFKNAIGVTRTEVRGTDVPARVYDFSETHYLSDLAVTQAYRLSLFNMTPSFNAAPFRGFAAGECLYRGTSGSKRGEDLWELTYHFSATPNQTNIDVGGIVVPNKLGWDFIDVYLEAIEDSASDRIIMAPRQVDVKRVTQIASLASLGIGA